jgi:hypothetical protein
MKTVPDVEEAVMAFLDRDVPAIAEKSRTEWPSPLEYPAVRIERLPGRRNRLNDYPWVDIEVLDEGVNGKLLLEAIDTALASYPRGVAVGDRFVKLELVQVITGPRRLPWSDDRVRRYAATYQLRTTRS